MQESINKDLEELKNKHTETNNTITEIKNTLEGINSRISEAEQTSRPTIGGQKQKGRKNSTFFKERIQLSLSLGKDFKHNKLKKYNRKRNTAQRKGQTRNPEVQINEEEIGKLPEKEFRIMIVKIIKNLENKMEKMQESINKDLEELKKKHTETNNTITETKDTLEGINSRISEAEK